MNASILDSDDTVPNEWPELGEHPYTGPVTGQQLAALDVLEEIAMAQDVQLTTEFPPYLGPVTGDQLSLLEHELAQEELSDGQWLDQITRERERAQAPEAAFAVIPERNADAVHRPAVAGHDRYRGVRRRGRRHQDGVAEGEGRRGPLAAWRAQVRTGPLFAGAAVSLAALAWWGARHAWQSAEAADGVREPFAWAYTLVFLLLAWQTAACYLERPRRGAATPDGLRTEVAVPVYNEDPVLLGRGLESLLSQSRRPYAVHVVDDGSRNEDGSPADYSGVRAQFEDAARAAGVATTWTRFPVNQGKRHAHAAAFKAAPRADVFITADSDVILDYRAVEEGMKPFADPRVQSVAGLLLIANHRRKLIPPPLDDRDAGRAARAAAMLSGLAGNCGKTLITRATELWYVTGELTDRSAQSAFSSVMVNTGTFALYRAPVIRENLAAYTAETFFGRPVQFSDDSLLTLFALLAGKTVQQPTAIGFTAMPDNLSHHARQYLRWMRGMTIRTFWRFRYLPLRSYAYWQHMARWVQAFTAIPVFFTVVIVEPIMRDSWSPGLLLVPLLVGYGRSLRYLTIRRHDEPWWSQALTYLLAPMVALWAYTGLRLIWWYGMATCLKTGWGTRQNGVEVTLGAS